MGCRGTTAAVIALVLMALTARAALAATPAPDFLPPSLQPFDREMRGWIARYGVAHASVAVMHDDKLMAAVGYGGRERNERVDIWSLSKAITAACIATLVRDRKLALADTLGKVLPPLNDKYGAFEDGRIDHATVADLITHRAGLATRFDNNNDIAPNLPALLRQMPPGAVKAEMLMPEIFRVRLARSPGTQYQYSNAGYLLLGQIIEARTGESYADACGRRVLAKAGVSKPSLDPVWGGILQAAGGWSLSAPEYLAFLRLLRAPEKHSAVVRMFVHGREDFFTPEIRTWLIDGNGKWIERGALAYTLGVNVRFPQMNIFHSGAWNWLQRDALDGPLYAKAGTWSVLTPDGTAWVATFDTVNSEEPDAMRELDDALWRARRAVTKWPEQDLFGALGIGPVATGK